MNIGIVTKLLGILACGLGATMLWPAAWALWYGDGGLAAILESAGISVAAGAALWLAGRKAKPSEIMRREGLAFVGLAWILAACIGALPYVLGGVLPSFPDALFESMSGFTTTGASVFEETDFASCPMGILFWRSLTHWLGGMGIVVLLVAVLPLVGVGGKQLLRFEVPGPKQDGGGGLHPRIKQTATTLWIVYVAISAAEVILLKIEGMTLFDSLCHTFGSMATGGFSTRYESVAAFASPSIDWTITFFMAAAGANFSLYVAVARGSFKPVLADVEWRVYLGILAAATATITALLLAGRFYGSILETLRIAAFQVVSIMTTTGFVTADFDAWPPAARMILIVLMFVGGCAGSTGGGIKVIRCIMLSKMASAAIRRVFAPHAVIPVRVGGISLDEGEQRGVLAFYLMWTAAFVAITVFVSFFVPHTDGPHDVTAAASAVAATLNNVGPGLSLVGATENYAFWAAPAKLALSFAMLIGRLELYAILSLLVPWFWRR